MIFFFSIFFKSYKEHWKMAQTQGALFIDRKGMNFFVWTFLFRKPISCFKSNISVVLIFLRSSLRFTLSAGQTHLERNTSYSFYFLKELILWHHDTCSQISFQTVLFIITLWFTSVHNCSDAKLFLSSPPPRKSITSSDSWMFHQLFNVIASLEEVLQSHRSAQIWCFVTNFMYVMSYPYLILFPLHFVAFSIHQLLQKVKTYNF